VKRSGFVLTRTLCQNKQDLAVRISEKITMFSFFTLGYEQLHFTSLGYSWC